MISKVNLPVLLLFAAFAFVCSCSSGGGDDDGDSSSSSEAAQTYEFCSYDEHEICLKGPFKECPGKGGELSTLGQTFEECKFLSSSSSGASSSSGGQVYCVYAAYEMCLEVIGSLDNKTCPPPMVPNSKCPYETIGPPDADPVTYGGNLNFEGTDYGGEYYVGSTVKVINTIKIENPDKARCGTAPVYTDSTTKYVIFDRDAIIDEAGRLTGTGTIIIRAVANCAGVEGKIIKEDSAKVVKAPPPDTLGVIKFKKEKYFADANKVVSLDSVEGTIKITNYEKAQCDSVATPIIINSGLSMPGVNVEAAAFVVCRGEIVTLATVTAEVDYAPPTHIGAVSFKGTAASSYNAGLNAYDSVTVTVNVTNPVQSGCDLNSRWVEVAGNILEKDSTITPGEITAQTYFMCHGDTTLVATTPTAKKVIPIGPELTGTISVIGPIDANTSIASIIANNINSTVKFSNAIYTACSTSVVNEQVLVGGTVTTTGNVTANKAITVRARLICDEEPYYIVSTNSVTTRPISPIFGGIIRIIGPIVAGTSVGSITVTNTINITNPNNTACPAAVATTEIYKIDGEDEILKSSSSSVELGEELIAKAVINCDGGIITVESEESVIVGPATPAYTGSIALGPFTVGEPVTGTSTITVTNPDESGCGQISYIDIKINDLPFETISSSSIAPNGTFSTTGNATYGALTAQAYATCNGTDKPIGAKAEIDVAYAEPNSSGGITFTTPIIVGKTIAGNSTIAITDEGKSGCGPIFIEIKINNVLFETISSSSIAPNGDFSTTGNATYGALTAQAYATCGVGTKKDIEDPEDASVEYEEPNATGNIEFTDPAAGSPLTGTASINIANKPHTGCGDAYIIITIDADEFERVDIISGSFTTTNTLTAGALKAQAWANCGIDEEPTYLEIEKETTVEEDDDGGGDD